MCIQYASRSETDKTYNPYCKGSLIDLNIWGSMDLYSFGVFFFKLIHIVKATQHHCIYLVCFHE